MAGEFEFLEWIRSLEATSEGLVVGIGDDLAAMKWDASDLLLVGVDQVIDGVHFDSSIHTPGQIGRKAVNRNLSDCAAMGCLPVAAVAAAALPKDFSIERAKDLYLGMRDAGKKYGCRLVGGDTGTWPGKLVLSVTIIGKSEGQKPVTRSGAKPGDAIYVTGPLGGSILGRHISFEPKVDLGRKIARFATSMIDLSDGLSRDLAHICRLSGVGAIIDAPAVPIHADAAELSKRDGLPEIEHALNDGEDYELLFTAPGEVQGSVRVGAIIPGSEILLRDSNANQSRLEAKGWQHSL
jgi:thiamine-monophosphate kinase